MRRLLCPVLPLCLHQDFANHLGLREPPTAIATWKDRPEAIQVSEEAVRCDEESRASVDIDEAYYIAPSDRFFPAYVTISLRATRSKADESHAERNSGSEASIIAFTLCRLAEEGS